MVRNNAVPRRTILESLSALTAATLFNAERSSAQAGSSPVSNAKYRIDTHHHYAVPGFRAALAQARQQRVLDWSVQKSLEDMDRSGVATAILSIGEPGLWSGNDEAARRLARESNEYGARLVRDHPGRFGLFAALPLPDVAGALREVEYALDVLKADGICLLSSYQGHYLGNPMFAPLMEELNRRGAVVFCHPACASCWVGGGYRVDLPENQHRVVEFVFDTSRTIVSLLASGSTRRYSQIRHIWSHGGGTVPFMTLRVATAASRPESEVIGELRRFFYDCATVVDPYALSAFKKLIPATQILFGTDYPFFDASTVANGLLTNGGFTEPELRAIQRDNAMRLLPRLKV